MPRYVVIEKEVGETPLDALERYRAQHPELAGVPMTYAGRLDPMARGALLLLIGDECKRQSAYHRLDKAYEFTVLFGVRSDTGDVLGVVEAAAAAPEISDAYLRRRCRSLRGALTLPYPHFSSKTVHGKPLHTWALEGRINEIEIPLHHARIYSLHPSPLTLVTGEEIYREARAKIDALPPVTDNRKVLGRDFRRADVLESWEGFRALHGNSQFPRAHMRAVVSSGTYIRSLAMHLAEGLTTTGLASSIHRTHIGTYLPLPCVGGWWTTRYA